MMSCDGRPGAGFSHEYCLNYHVLSDILTINRLSLCVGRQREVPPRCRICCLKRRKGFNSCCSKERVSADSNASTTRIQIDRNLKNLENRCRLKSGIATCKRISGPGDLPCAQLPTFVSTSRGATASSSAGDYVTPKQCEIDSMELDAFGGLETQRDSDDKVNKKNKAKGDDEKKGDDVNGQEKETDHSPSQSSNSERQMPSTEILCILRHAHPDVALEMPPLPMQNANFQRYLVQCNHDSLLDIFQDRLAYGRIADETSSQVVTHNGAELYRIVTVENGTRSNFRSKLFYAASAA